jgi:hypothetical protein
MIEIGRHLSARPSRAVRRHRSDGTERYAGVARRAREAEPQRHGEPPRQSPDPLSDLISIIPYPRHIAAEIERLTPSDPLIPLTVPGSRPE